MTVTIVVSLEQPNFHAICYHLMPLLIICIPLALHSQPVNPWAEYWRIDRVHQHFYGTDVQWTLTWTAEHCRLRPSALPVCLINRKLEKLMKF